MRGPSSAPPPSGEGPSAGEPARRHRFAWLPDVLGVARVALVAPFLGGLWSVGQGAIATSLERTLLASLLALIGLSDILDGFLARRWGLESPRGAALDAAADKIAMLGALVILSLNPGQAFTRLPRWLLGVVLARDALLVAGWLYFRRRGRAEVAEHRWHGKLGTVLLFLLVGGAVLGLPAAVLLSAAGMTVVVLALSTAAYVRSGFRSTPGE